ncbi:MAG: hypothetical protein AAF548_09505 [Actinomycetota bacterium]
MSYPPEHHLLRDLRFSGEYGPRHTINHLPVTDGLRADGSVRLGVLATMVDVTGAGIALRSVSPDWIATADLSIHVLRPIDGDMVDVACEPLRVGKGNVVIDATIIDSGVVCGTGRMAFARIPGSATKATIDAAIDPNEVETRPPMDGGTPIDRPIDELCGFDVVGPGQLRFEKSPYVANSFGTVNGGVMAFAAEHAAVSATGGGRAVDVQIHYLEQVGEGPVAVTAEVARDRGDGDLALVGVRLEDRSDRRLVAVADVMVQAD